MSEVIIFFLNNVTVILISLILLSNFFVVFRVCTVTAAGPATATAKNKKKTIPQQ